MNLIICTDENWGLSFLGRRLSRDAAQRRHMLELADGHDLYMSPYSVRLFIGNGKKMDDFPENIRVSEALFEDASSGDFVFSECEDISFLEDRIEKLYVYHWGRNYPSDLRVPETLVRKLIPVRSERIRGTSHDDMIFEEYRIGDCNE